MTFRDTLLDSEFVHDEEESFIQSFIMDNDSDMAQPSLQYSSTKDPYAAVTYTDLSEELKLVTDTKCFAYVGQLVRLAGQKCHVLGCGEDIDVSVHTNCGYGVKLSWTCKKQHRYIYLCKEYKLYVRNVQ